MEFRFGTQENQMLPSRLKSGDTIGIVSPSNPIIDDVRDQFQRGVKTLESMGFRVVVGNHVFSTTLGYAADPREKADDINSMFADPAIHAIICSQGGASSNACLPYLDWELIRHNPKIFLGISDITVLLNAIHHKTGLITFHGDDITWGFGREVAPYTQQEFTARLMRGTIGLIPASRERQTIRGGSAEGKLLGGNADCLQKIIGTPYFPDFTDAILFVETYGGSPAHMDCLFRQYEQMGIFQQIRGAVVGYIDIWDDPALPQEEVLRRVTAAYDFPILKAPDFGHNCPNAVLPVGVRVRIDADRGEIELLEAFVR
jgi:muramoyltetrapeptide carboxypeptidase